MYWVTGTPGNPQRPTRCRPDGFGDVPTIFDRLQAAGRLLEVLRRRTTTRRSIPHAGAATHAAQIVRVPLLNYTRFLDDPALLSHIVDLTSTTRTCADGTLPAVAYIVPSGASEHPPGQHRRPASASSAAWSTR